MTCFVFVSSLIFRTTLQSAERRIDELFTKELKLSLMMNMEKMESAVKFLEME